MSIASQARCYNRECPIMFVQSDGVLCHDFDKCAKFKPSEEMKEANDAIERENDPVNCPSHYQGSYECIELMEAMFGTFEMMIFCKINAYKYRFRTGRKLGVDASEDIKKAEYYEKKFMKYRDQMERIV